MGTLLNCLCYFRQRPWLPCYSRESVRGPLIEQVTGRVCYGQPGREHVWAVVSHWWWVRLGEDVVTCCTCCPLGLLLLLFLGFYPKCAVLLSQMLFFCAQKGSIGITVLGWAEAICCTRCENKQGSGHGLSLSLQR